MSYFKYIPFAPSNSDGLLTSDDKNFLVKSLIDGYVELILYKNSAEQLRVDKTNYLTKIASMFGVFRDSISITSMAIEIEYPNIPDFNYVHIPQFNRYYYVNDYSIDGNKRFTINLSIDILMSYKDGIKNLNGFVERNEFTKNNLLTDNKRVVENGADFTETVIENNLFTPIPSYMLTGFKVRTQLDSMISFYVYPDYSSQYYIPEFNGEKPTWEDWCISGWNTLGAYTIDSDNYVHLDNEYVLAIAGMYVPKNNKPATGIAYYIVKVGEYSE